MNPTEVFFRIESNGVLLSLRSIKVEELLDQLSDCGRAVLYIVISYYIYSLFK
jgi:hypothetical protein